MTCLDLLKPRLNPDAICPTDLTGVKVHIKINRSSGSSTSKKASPPIGGWLNQQAIFYAMNCPSAFELGEYRLRLLPPPHMHQIRQHLAACSLCVQHLNQLERFLQERSPEMAAPIDERTAILVAHPIAISQPTAAHPSSHANPALANSATEIRLYQAKSVQIVVEIRPELPLAESQRKTVVGQVSLTAVPATTIQLWRADALVTTIPIDSEGNFTLANLEAASYQLLITGPELEIHIGHFEL